MTQLPTEDQCKKLFEAALPGIDWSKYENVYSAEESNAVFYAYAVGIGNQTDFAIKICRHYGSFHAGMKLRFGGHHEWNIVMFDVVAFSRVAEEMLKDWKW
jgi:hypothetical protein